MEVNVIDWTKPLETVPNERNPEPVPCKLDQLDTDNGAEVYIEGEWFTDDGDNQGSGYMPWAYDGDGDPHYHRLPLIRNVEA